MVEKNKDRYKWMLHLAAIITSIAALITSITGSKEQDKISKGIFNSVVLEILPSYSERIAIIEENTKELKIICESLSKHKKLEPDSELKPIAKKYSNNNSSSNVNNSFINKLEKYKMPSSYEQFKQEQIRE